MSSRKSKKTNQNATEQVASQVLASSSTPASASSATAPAQPNLERRLQGPSSSSLSVTSSGGSTTDGDAGQVSPEIIGLRRSIDLLRSELKDQEKKHAEEMAEVTALLRQVLQNCQRPTVTVAEESSSSSESDGDQHLNTGSKRQTRYPQLSLSIHEI